MKVSAAVFSNVLALALYMVGLIGPLTPSEGMPTAFNILLFAVIPVTILLICWRAYQGRTAKAAALVQALLIVAFSGWLSWFLYKTS